MKEKQQIDDVKWERTHDREGYDAYRFILSYQGKPVDIVICDKVSHRRACDQVANLISKKYICESPVVPSLQGHDLINPLP